MTTTMPATSSNEAGRISSIWVPPAQRAAKTRAQLFAEAFPKVDPGYAPLGERVLIQLRMPRVETEGGIIIPDDSKDTDRDVQQVAVVVAIGPLAYKNRTTLEPWPEGAWVKEGDFIRAPRYGGDRVGIPHPDGRPDLVTFLTIRDHEVIAMITTGDPLTMKAYV